MESNPNEAQVGGPGVVGSEMSVPTAVASDSFLVPVRSEAVPLVVVPDSINGAEDTEFRLGGINTAQEKSTTRNCWIKTRGAVHSYWSVVNEAAIGQVVGTSTVITNGARTSILSAE